MKKYMFVYIFCCSFISCSFSQEPSKAKNVNPDFKTFLDVFPPRKVPFKMYSNSELATPFDVPLPVIPNDFFERYVEIKELNDALAICPKEFIYGYRAFSIFDLTTEVVTVIISISADAGCGERDLMINYNLQGEYIDHILVYGSGFLKEPTSDDNSRTMIFHEGLVEKEYIEVYERVLEYSSKNQIISEKNTTRVYKIGLNGEFQLVQKRID